MRTLYIIVFAIMVCALSCTRTSMDNLETTTTSNGSFNEVVWADTTFGPSLEFDGANDLVYLANYAQLTLEGSITIEALIYPYDVVTDPGGSNRTILRKGNVGNDINYHFGLNPNSGPGVLQFGTNGAGIHSPENTIVENVWQHVVGVYNADSSTYALYVDGNLVAHEPTSESPAPTDDPLTMGQTLKDHPGDFEDMFEGMIKRVRIWQRPLSTEEVRTHIHATLATSLGGLVGAWGMHEGHGQHLRDGVNGSHGTLGRSRIEDSDDPAWVY